MQVGVDGFEDALGKLLAEYSDRVFDVLNDDALDAAEKVLIDNLKAASPQRAEGKSRGFYKAWKSTGKKYKAKRYVHNTTMVDGGGGKIPLSNILEYSTKHGRPFVKQTHDASAGEMAQAAFNVIKSKI